MPSQWIHNIENLTTKKSTLLREAGRYLAQTTDVITEQSSHTSMAQAARHNPELTAFYQRMVWDQQERLGREVAKYARYLRGELQPISPQALSRTAAMQAAQRWCEQRDYRLVKPPQWE